MVSNKPVGPNKVNKYIYFTGTYLYMVNTSADYGWVQCSGTNVVGRQTKPCLFQILPAGESFFIVFIQYYMALYLLKTRKRLFRKICQETLI